MTDKELFYFTGKCLMLDEQTRYRHEIIDVSSTNRINWQQFVTLCSDHLILPVIYLKFQSQDVLQFMPEVLSEYLKEIYELNVSRNQLILIQLQEITHVLNQHNIFPTFLKGSGNLLDGLYSDIGERILGDIDFLVPEKDYLEAARIMESEGYTKTSPTPEYLDVKSMKHYPRLSHTGFAASIEIHRLPVPENYQSWFNTAIIDQEKKPVASLAGCFVQCDHHKIIHNFIHSQLSNSGHANGIVSFRDLYDLYLLSGRTAVQEILPQIRSRQKEKAIAYFVFAGKALGISGRFYPKSNLTSWLFSKKHDLNMRSNSFYQVNRSIYFLGHQLFAKYMGQFIRSFYSRRMRHSLIGRLSDRNWYHTHMNYYRSFFSRK
ncbi:MAG: nucleotidyltransferase family protein [Bacteroidota bacterium]|nr:nucleotidyltransferase family protein [Bacteroidota bacterium]